MRRSRLKEQVDGHCISVSSNGLRPAELKMRKKELFVSKHEWNYLLSGSESAVTEQRSGILHSVGLWQKFFKAHPFHALI